MVNSVGLLNSVSSSEYPMSLTRIEWKNVEIIVVVRVACQIIAEKPSTEGKLLYIRIRIEVSEVRVLVVTMNISQVLGFGFSRRI